MRETVVPFDGFVSNQKVLKDPYSLYELNHAGDAEVASLGTVVPDNIKSDYAVYVDNSQFATKVVGYRNENTWYDKNGTVITYFIDGGVVKEMQCNQFDTVVDENGKRIKIWED